MMKRFFLSSLVALMVFDAVAQSSDEKPEWANGLPKAGDFSIGFSVNPIAASKSKHSDIDDAYLYVGDSELWLGDTEQNPHQMFFLSQQPLVSIDFKYFLDSEKALKLKAGFSGGVLNYREYVSDDAARAVNPMSEAVTSDRARANYTGGSITVGMEFHKGKRLRFVGGFGLVYAFGGGRMSFEYGNTLTTLNPHPTTMSKIDGIGDRQLNEFTPNPQMDYARPTKRYNTGLIHGLGIEGDLGVEWFFIPRTSIGANLTVIPVMVAFQPQTYTKYEGVNNFTNSVEEYNKLVSPGSNYLLYGTDNLSFSLSLRYYF